MRERLPQYIRGMRKIPHVTLCHIMPPIDNLTSDLEAGASSSTCGGRRKQTKTC